MGFKRSGEDQSFVRSFLLSGAAFRNCERRLITGYRSSMAHLVTSYFFLDFLAFYTHYTGLFTLLSTGKDLAFSRCPLILMKKIGFRIHRNVGGKIGMEISKSRRAKGVISYVIRSVGAVLWHLQVWVHAWAKKGNVKRSSEFCFLPHSINQIPI